MALIDKSNRSLHILGLKDQVRILLATELGWINVLDILVFLRHTSGEWSEGRATAKQRIENKLIRCNGLGKARIRMVVDALIQHEII